VVQEQRQGLVVRGQGLKVEGQGLVNWSSRTTMLGTEFELVEVEDLEYTQYSKRQSRKERRPLCLDVSAVGVEMSAC